ncbi:Limbin, partial [Myotis brandtii]
HGDISRDTQGTSEDGVVFQKCAVVSGPSVAQTAQVHLLVNNTAAPGAADLSDLLLLDNITGLAVRESAGNKTSAGLQAFRRRFLQVGDSFSVSYTASLEAGDLGRGEVLVLPALLTFQSASVNRTQLKALLTITAEETVTVLPNHGLHAAGFFVAFIVSLVLTWVTLFFMVRYQCFKRSMFTRYQVSLRAHLLPGGRLLGDGCEVEVYPPVQWVSIPGGQQNPLGNYGQALMLEIATLNRADSDLEACRTQISKDVIALLLRDLSSRGHLAPQVERRMGAAFKKQFLMLEKEIQEEYDRKMVALTAECDLETRKKTENQFQREAAAMEEAEELLKHVSERITGSRGAFPTRGLWLLSDVRLEIATLNRADSDLEACRTQISKDVIALLLRDLSSRGHLAPQVERRMGAAFKKQFLMLEKEIQEEYDRKMVALTAECDLETRKKTENQFQREAAAMEEAEELLKHVSERSAGECSSLLRTLHGLEQEQLRRSLALQQEEDFAKAHRQLAVFQRSELHGIFFAQIKSAIFKGDLQPEAAKMLLQDYSRIQEEVEELMDFFQASKRYHLSKRFGHREYLVQNMQSAETRAQGLLSAAAAQLTLLIQKHERAGYLDEEQTEELMERAQTEVFSIKQKLDNDLKQEKKKLHQKLIVKRRREMLQKHKEQRREQLSVGEAFRAAEDVGQYLGQGLSLRLKDDALEASAEEQAELRHWGRWIFLRLCGSPFSLSEEELLRMRQDVHSCFAQMDRSLALPRIRARVLLQRLHTAWREAEFLKLDQALAAPELQPQAKARKPRAKSKSKTDLLRKCIEDKIQLFDGPAPEDLLEKELQELERKLEEELAHQEAAQRQRALAGRQQWAEDGPGLLTEPEDADSKGQVSAALRRALGRSQELLERQQQSLREEQERSVMLEDLLERMEADAFMGLYSQELRLASYLSKLTMVPAGTLRRLLSVALPAAPQPELLALLESLSQKQPDPAAEHDGGGEQADLDRRGKHQGWWQALESRLRGELRSSGLDKMLWARRRKESILRKTCPPLRERTVCSGKGGWPHLSLESSGDLVPVPIVGAEAIDLLNTGEKLFIFRNPAEPEVSLRVPPRKKKNFLNAKKAAWAAGVD